MGIHADKKDERESRNYPKWLTIFRIALGLILFWKGISFIKDTGLLGSRILNTGIGIFDNNLQTVAFVIAFINLLGGFFIAVGLFTRWACIVLIPILAGAVFLVNLEGGISITNSELVLSVIVLILLIIFTKKGSGILSADEFFRSYTHAGPESGHTRKLIQ